MVVVVFFVGDSGQLAGRTGLSTDNVSGVGNWLTSGFSKPYIQIGHSMMWLIFI